MHAEMSIKCLAQLNVTLAYTFMTFFFEMEGSEQQKTQSERNATKVGDHDGQPSPKKMRTEETGRNPFEKGDRNNDEAGSSRGVA